MNKEELQPLYQESNQSIDSVKKAENLGCFYCEKQVDFGSIHQGIHEGKQIRGRCPHCGIDALLPLDAYPSKYHSQILEKMYRAYFKETSLLGEWLA